MPSIPGAALYNVRPSSGSNMGTARRGLAARGRDDAKKRRVRWNMAKLLLIDVCLHMRSLELQAGACSLARTERLGLPELSVALTMNCAKTAGYETGACLE